MRAAPPGEERSIVAFLCRWCSYQGADLAGSSRLPCPAGLRAVRLPCSGRVSPELVLRAFQDGADGVLVLACHPGDCHYLEGNQRMVRRMRLLQRLLGHAGIEPSRLSWGFVSAAEGDRFARIAEAFAQALRDLPPISERIPVGDPDLRAGGFRPTDQETGGARRPEQRSDEPRPTNGESGIARTGLGPRETAPGADGLRGRQAAAEYARRQSRFESTDRSLRTREDPRWPGLREEVEGALREVGGVLALREAHGEAAPHLYHPGESLEDLALGPRAPLPGVLLRLQAADPRERLGVVCRRCEERGLVELAKRRKIDLSRLLVLGVACLPEEAEACQCLEPVPLLAERVVRCPTAPHPQAEGVVRCPTAPHPQAERVVRYSTAPHPQAEAAPPLLFASEEGMETAPPLLFTPEEGMEMAPPLPPTTLAERADFWRYWSDRCLKCYACVAACPQCFCPDCALEEAHWVEKGRLPPPFPTFHLIKAIHMAGRCTGCRECEQACPARIPLTLLYRSVARDVEELWGYRTGASLEAVPPLLLASEEGPGTVPPLPLAPEEGPGTVPPLPLAPEEGDAP